MWGSRGMAKSLKKVWRHSVKVRSPQYCSCYWICIWTKVLTKWGLFLRKSTTNLSIYPANYSAESLWTIITHFYIMFYFIQAAAKMIKDSLDKKFGSSWHCIVGEGYGFDITHEVKNLLYMYFGGTTAIMLWKCS